MIKIKKKLGSFVLILCAAMSNTVHAMIKVGTVHFDPPYVLSIDQGFEIDLIKLICQRLKTQCQLIPMERDKLFDELLAGKIDIAIDGIDFFSSNNPLNDQFIYSLPYLPSEAQFLVLKNSPISSVQALPKGSTIGMVRERFESTRGIFFVFFNAIYHDEFKAVLYKNLNALIAALNDGEVDAAFLDVNQANYWILNGEFKGISKPIPIADGIGIVTVQKNVALLQQINQELMKIGNSQNYIHLYNTYIGGL